MLLLFRGVLTLSAPALVLLLFSSQPTEVEAFLTHAPIAILFLLLLLCALFDFFSGLWRLSCACRYESRFLPLLFYGWQPLFSSLFRLERAVRWSRLCVRGEWLLVVLWLCAAAWINFSLALPLIFGGVFALVLFFISVMLLRLAAEGRERMFSSNALRFAALLSQARARGFFDLFVSRSLAKHARARGCENRVIVTSLVLSLLLRVCLLITFATSLLYGLTLVGRAGADMGEVVASLVLLGFVFSLLERQARDLSYYAKPLSSFEPFVAVGSSRGRGESSDSAQPRPLSADSAESTATIIRAVDGGDGGEASNKGRCFAYVPSGAEGFKLMLDGLSLARGEVVALAGASSSGKSLFLRACAGIYPSEGLLFLDAPYARSATKSSYTSLPIGYVPQEALLLEGTLAENITQFEQVFGNRRMLDLLTSLGVHEKLAACVSGSGGGFSGGLIDSLSMGVDAFDSRFSYSLKVQIMLAAAMYRNPRLLLLDASVDSLDSHGISALARVLHTMQRSGVAMIIATEKAELLGLCSRALLCEQQRVVSRAISV